MGRHGSAPNVSPNVEELAREIEICQPYLLHNHFIEGRPSLTRKVSMKNLVTRGVVGIAALAVSAGAAMALPMAAQASPTTVKAVTLTLHRPDTTSTSGPGTVASPDGPVWAHDDLFLQLTAIKDGTHTYSVTINAAGSFYANANPRTGAAYKGHGPIKGWLNYEVSSPTAPNARYVALQEPGKLSQSAILNQLFGRDATIIGGGHYHYQYTGLPGGTYIQNG